MNRYVFALALLLSVPALASPPDRGERPPPPDQIILDSAEDLGIDDATLAEIEALFAAQRPAMEAAHAAARAAMESGDEAGGRAAMEAAHEEGRAVMDAVMAMLTEEQRDALAEILPPPPSGPGQGQGQRPGRR
jgi:flagellar biosynthesis/type III secretory pathway protein FliH